MLLCDPPCLFYRRTRVPNTRGATVMLTPAPDCGRGVQSRHVVYRTDGSYVNALTGIPIRTLCPYPGPRGERLWLHRPPACLCLKKVWNVPGPLACGLQQAGRCPPANSVEMGRLACKPAACQFLLADILKATFGVIFGQVLHYLISVNTVKVRTCPECGSNTHFPRLIDI